MNLSRRSFFYLLGLGLGGTVLTSYTKKFKSALAAPESLFVNRFGNLQSDPKRIIDLPPGFKYKIISVVGETMNDGFAVPNNHDGMGALAGKNGETILIRNHELNSLAHKNELTANTPQYDSSCPGCTTTLVIDRDRNLKKHYLSLAGTNRNCSGGITPWNSWLSCEEDIATPYAPPGFSLEQIGYFWGKVSKKHGYNFEVFADRAIAEPKPLKAMGRFRHEAIAVDPQTNYIYQTEDRRDGGFYRFRPHKDQDLAAGGVLEAMVIVDLPRIDTGLNFPVGETKSVKWVKIEDVDPEHDSLRYEAQTKGAAIFRRGEGICLSEGEFYFTCTSGGQAEVGQIFRYNPSQETIELFLESPGAELLDYPDNLIIAPFGDLIVCEDGLGEQRLIGITPEGKYYQFARNALNNSEFAGACFSADGQTMFVNIYNPGMTLAIWGDWGKV